MCHNTCDIDAIRPPFCAFHLVQSWNGVFNVQSTWGITDMLNRSCSLNPMQVKWNWNITTFHILSTLAPLVWTHLKYWWNDCRLYVHHISNITHMCCRYWLNHISLIRMPCNWLHDTWSIHINRPDLFDWQISMIVNQTLAIIMEPVLMGLMPSHVIVCLDMKERYVTVVTMHIHTCCYCVIYLLQSMSTSSRHGLLKIW